MPELRTGLAPNLAPLGVRRPGPHSDLGRLLARLRGAAAPQERFVYTDPAGIIDADLRRRTESWPEAMHGDGVVRPAELWSIGLTGVGLVVTSVSWWDSAPALDHQIGLALDLAHRLAAHR